MTNKDYVLAIALLVFGKSDATVVDRLFLIALMNQESFSIKL